MGSIENNTSQQITNPFKGTWQYQNGNQRFLVSIWVDSENIMLGHYKMITIDSNGNQTGVLYNSKKPIGTSTTNWPYAIYMGTYDGLAEGGVIKDNTVNNPRGFIEGRFRLSIENGNSPITAHWIVEKMQGIQETGEPNFSIPTDIILTKISNTVNLD